MLPSPKRQTSLPSRTRKSAANHHRRRCLVDDRLALLAQAEVDRSVDLEDGGQGRADLGHVGRTDHGQVRQGAGGRPRPRREWCVGPSEA